MKRLRRKNCLRRDLGKHSWQRRGDASQAELVPVRAHHLAVWLQIGRYSCSV